MVEEDDPDAVFISLGMNELFEAQPDRKLKSAVEGILSAVGTRPILWVYPLHGSDMTRVRCLTTGLRMNSERVFFRSYDLSLPRQSAKNPHPTRAGMVQWMDSVVNWMPEHAEVVLPGINKPEGDKMSRGKDFYLQTHEGKFIILWNSEIWKRKIIRLS